MKLEKHFFRGICIECRYDDCDLSFHLHRVCFDTKVRNRNKIGAYTRWSRIVRLVTRAKRQERGYRTESGLLNFLLEEEKKRNYCVEMSSWKMVDICVCQHSTHPLQHVTNKMTQNAVLMSTCCISIFQEAIRELITLRVLCFATSEKVSSKAIPDL